MPTITVIFDSSLLPVGTPASTTFTADPATVTLKVKNDSVCYFAHPNTNKDEVVTQVNTTLTGGNFKVTLTPYDTTHPAVTEKAYSVRSQPLPHEDKLTDGTQGNNLVVTVDAPSVSGKTTTYLLSTTVPPFLTIKVKRQ